MYAVIRRYHFDLKNGAEIDRQVREGFVPIIKKVKGFYDTIGSHWHGRRGIDQYLPRQSGR